MSEPFSRIELLIGSDGLKKLFESRVAVFGVGGVGGYVVEALARSGVGTLDLIDNDIVALSNINRQIIATYATLGMPKVDAAEKRALDINPNIKINKHKIFFMPNMDYELDFNSYDYVVDAIDTVAGKLEIIECAKRANIPVISSMGAGNKMYPEKLEIADISKTSVCPLARVMRQELKKRNIKDVKVVYSKESPVVPKYSDKILAGNADYCKKLPPGSNAFVPSVAGLIIAGQVIRDLIAGKAN